MSQLSPVSNHTGPRGPSRTHTRSGNMWPELLPQHQTTLQAGGPSSPITHRQGKQGPERVSNFPKLIQQERNRTRMRTQQPVNQTLSTPAHHRFKAKSYRVTARSQLSQDVVGVPREEWRRGQWSAKFFLFLTTPPPQPPRAAGKKIELQRQFLTRKRGNN